MTTQTLTHPEMTARRIAELTGLPVPTAEQQRVIEADMEPLLVVAGAGSGKTETMSMRVLHMVAARGLSPDQILGLTFSRKAAAELGQRLRARLSTLSQHCDGISTTEDPGCMTYHSFAQQIVHDHGMRLGIDPNQRLIGQAGAVQMMTDIVEMWPRDLGSDKSVSSLVDSALGLAGQIAEHAMSIDEMRVFLDEFGTALREIGKLTGVLKRMVDTNDLRLRLLDLIDAFSERKRSERVVDFSDLLILANRLAHSAPAVRDQLRADYHAVFLDEFQDTSVIQMKFLAALFHDHPVTAVGDPNQSIYSWRGASAGSLKSFLDRFCSDTPHAEQTQYLSTAFRNDRMILDVANHVSKPLREDSDIPQLKTLEQTLTADLERARREAAPVAEQQRLEQAVQAARERAHDGVVDVAFETSTQDQAETVARFLAKHRQRRGSRWSSAAVLCRRTSDFIAVEKTLRAHDIPTQVIGLGGLLQQPAVSDVRAALRLSVDVSDSPAALRLVTNLDLGASDLQVLGKWARARNTRTPGDHPLTYLLDALDTPPPAHWRGDDASPAISAAAVARVEVLSSKLRAIREWSGHPVTDQVERAISVLGVATDAIADPMPNDGREALDTFVDVARNFEKDAPDPSMRAFLAWLDVAEQEERGLAGPHTDPDPDAVQILTIHGAKGLEWDSVVVYGLGDGIFPSHRSNSVTWRDDPPGANGWLERSSEIPYPLRGDADYLPALTIGEGEGRTPQSVFNNWISQTYRPEMGWQTEREERRLAYVALTRARHHMLLTGAWVASSAKLHFPSRYLMEPLEAGLTAADPERAIAPQPEPEEVAQLLAAQDSPLFPAPPDVSRQRMTQVAHAVQDAMTRHSGEATDGDTHLARTPHPLAADTRVLLDEHLLRKHDDALVVPLSRIPATSVTRLLSSPDEYARDLRRPIPREPSDAATLGTLFHSWVERQLRMVSGELWDEHIPGEETLSSAQHRRFDAMKGIFNTLPIVNTGKPIAVEEPFSVRIGSLSIPGRFDAVFEDADGRTVIIDWKTGRAPTRNPSGALTAQAHLTQLRLYTAAWAQRSGTDPDDIHARIVYLGGNPSVPADQRMYSREALDAIVREYDSPINDLETALQAVFTQSPA